MFLQWRSGAAPSWHGPRLQMVPGGQPRRARGPRAGVLPLSSTLDLLSWPRVLPFSAYSHPHRHCTNTCRTGSASAFSIAWPPRVCVRTPAVAAPRPLCPSPLLAPLRSPLASRRVSAQVTRSPPGSRADGTAQGRQRLSTSEQASPRTGERSRAISVGTRRKALK